MIFFKHADAARSVRPVRRRFHRWYPISWMLRGNFDRAPYANCPTFSRSFVSSLASHGLRQRRCYYFFYLCRVGATLREIDDRGKRYTEFERKKEREREGREGRCFPFFTRISIYACFRYDFSPIESCLPQFCSLGGSSVWGDVKINRARESSQSRSFVLRFYGVLHRECIDFSHRRHRKIDNEEYAKKEIKSSRKEKLTAGLRSPLTVWYWIKVPGRKSFLAATASLQLLAIYVFYLAIDQYFLK